MDTNNGRSFGEWLRDQMRLVDHDSLALTARGYCSRWGRWPLPCWHPVCGQSPGSGALGRRIGALHHHAPDLHQCCGGRAAPPASDPSAWLLLPFVAGITMSVVVQGARHPLGLSGRRLCLFRAHAPDCAAEQHGDSFAYVTLLAAALIEMPLALRLFATLLLTIIMINIVLQCDCRPASQAENQALTDPSPAPTTGASWKKVLDALVARAERQPLVPPY